MKIMAKIIIIHKDAFGKFLAKCFWQIFHGEIRHNFFNATFLQILIKMKIINQKGKLGIWRRTGYLRRKSNTIYLNVYQHIGTTSGTMASIVLIDCILFINLFKIRIFLLKLVNLVGHSDIQTYASNNLIIKTKPFPFQMRV